MAVNMEQQTDRLHKQLHRLDRQVGNILRICIFISIALILSGLVVFALQGSPILADLVSISALYTEMLKLNPAAFITTGIIIILLMPMLIILTSLTHFAVTKERTPIIVCIILLVMLGASSIYIWK